MPAPWFASWFDSPYYPALYQHRNEIEAERFVLNLLQVLDPAPDARFLDLACGRGRHARTVHAQGYTVTGLDLSPASIEDAKNSAAPGLEFLVHDMRDPYPGRYDFILNLFTSFGYFDHTDENLKVLRNVAAAMLPGGTFVMDFMNASKVVAKLVPSESKEIDGVIYDITRQVEAGIIVKRIHVNDNGQHFDFAERVQALDRNLLEALMLKAGLKVVDCWGDYHGSPFVAADSDRTVLFCKHAD